MFGVHCFVVQVLHRRRKRGVGCLPMFGVHCFVVQVLHRRRKVGGGGGPPNNLRGGQPPPPPPNNPPTFSFNFYVKQKKNQIRTKLKGKTK